MKTRRALGRFGLTLMMLTIAAAAANGQTVVRPGFNELLRHLFDDVGDAKSARASESPAGSATSREGGNAEAQGFPRRFDGGVASGAGGDGRLVFSQARSA